MAKRSDTEAVLKEIYPIIANAMNKNYIAWKHCISQFIQARSESLFDIAPCDRIYYTDFDRDNLLTALGITEKEIKDLLRHTYYWEINPFNPRSAKDPITIIVFCIVRYFFMNNREKDLDLAMVYQSFSGKYYPSIHSGSFKLTTPAKYRHVMEFVVNHKLTNKFDLKSTGSVIGAIKNINTTWIKSYAKIMKSCEDEDVVYLIQQLHTRIKSFIKNIAKLYYESYKDKDYIKYDKDDLGDGNGSGFHLTTNDNFKLQRYTQNTMTMINTSQVSYAICKQASDANVKTEEVKNIIEAILTVRENLAKVEEYISLTIASFLSSSEVKDVNSIQYYSHCVKTKPNVKDPALIRIRDLMEELLDDVSIGYRKRKSRASTKQSYHRAFAIYFALLVIRANQ